MFTGIVQERGYIQSVVPVENGVRLEIEATETLKGFAVGDSIAVSGVCLTTIQVDPHGFSTHAMPETLQRTTLGSLMPGDAVNLEQPLRAGDPLGGHIMQGHIDGVAKVVSISPNPDGSTDMRFMVSDDLMRYIVEKGSIAGDGVSLTVAEVNDREFVVALIPHTLEVTTLGLCKTGDRVNLEVDVFAKYIEKMLETRP